MKHPGLTLSLILLFAVPLLAQNAELKKLFDEDVASRTGATNIQRSDEDRQKLVLEMLAKNQVQTPEDKFNAGLILQHTGMDFCEGRLVSKSPQNYLLAHYLARESYAAGYQSAKNMIAVTIDRYLAMTEGRQLYGTQRLFNQKTEKEELVYIDRSVPDSERAKYGVPPLAEILKQYPERPAPKKKPDSK